MNTKPNRIAALVVVALVAVVAGAHCWRHAAADVPRIFPHLNRTDALVARTMETTPFVWRGRLLLLQSDRADAIPTLSIRDERGAVVSRFAPGYAMASAIVAIGALYVYASRIDPDHSDNDVTEFHSTDLVHWSAPAVVLREAAGEHYFNSSVCAAPGGYLMAYECDKPVSFSIKWAKSSDLVHWAYAGEGIGLNEYTACPTVRFSEGWYYCFWLQHVAGRWRFATRVSRSSDLVHWELSPATVLEPTGKQKSASDLDLVEYHGRSLIYYAVGDQRHWCYVCRASCAMPMDRFLSGWFN